MTTLRIADNVISTPLCYAARMGKIDLVCQLMKKGRVNIHDNRGWAPLHEAVAAGHTDCAKLLLQHEECNVDACTFEGMSPLFVACQYQNKLELINILIDHGASINKANNENETPLHVACKSYKLEIVKVLVKHGANVNDQDFNNFTPLMDAIDQVGTMWNKRQETPFEEVHFLLENEACVKLTDLHGRTSLLIAVCEKWYECVHLLVQYGSDVNASTEDGTTAIMLAAQANDLPVVKFLLDSGAVPDISCKNGRMPLHHALHNGFMSTAEELINKMDLKGIFERKEKIDSFLIIAIDSGSFESFNFVIKHKLYSAVEFAPFENPHSICPLNYEYHTPLTFLLQHHIENPHGKLMMEILLETGDFHVNAPKIGCIPPLIALISSPCIEKCMEHIKLECFFNLLEKGANIDYCNTERNKQLPDAIVTVVRPRRCNVSQIFLLPVLAHCFMCDWDCVLDWVVENDKARSSVVYTLLKLSGKSKQNLWNIWKNLKLCPCDVCRNEAPSIKKCIDEKIMTLQSLCRPIVRQWLWKRTVNSHDAKNILIDMCIPLPKATDDSELQTQSIVTEQKHFDLHLSTINEKMKEESKFTTTDGNPSQHLRRQLRKNKIAICYNSHKCHVIPTCWVSVDRNGRIGRIPCPAMVSSSSRAIVYIMKRGAGVSSDEGSSKKPFWALGLLTAMKDPKSVRKEDDRIVVITDKYAKAEHHFLVLPKENIPHAGKLNRDHIPLLKHMEYVAKEIANEYTDHNFLFGYHAQASMARLHLHVISDDFHSPALKSKKHWNSFTTNFFIPSEEMIKKIEKNGKFDQISPIRAKELLDTPLKCHKCSTTALNMPKLKQHLLIHCVKEKKSI